MPPWSKHEERLRQRDARIVALWRNRVGTSITQQAIAERFGISAARVQSIIKTAEKRDENP